MRSTTASLVTFHEAPLNASKRARSCYASREATAVRLCYVSDTVVLRMCAACAAFRGGPGAFVSACAPVVRRLEPHVRRSCGARGTFGGA